MGKFIDLTGQQFGRLMVIRRADNRQRSYGTMACWLCRCECGIERIILSDSLRTGRTRSCGCTIREQTIRRSTTHGDTAGKRFTPEYTTWCNIRTRCFDPHTPGWDNYGGRGITVCQRWLQYTAFLADIGRRPSAHHSIDRIDNDGHYSCGHCTQCQAQHWSANCRWATRHEQGAHKRNNVLLSFNGKTQPLSVWARELGMAPSALLRRSYLGWSVERMLTKPLRKSAQRKEHTHT